MVRNDAGIFRDDRDKHPEKTEEPIVTSEEPRVNEEMPEHSANADASILFVILGIVRLVKPEHP